MLLPIIGKIQNKIEQSHWLKKLAKDLEVTEESVNQELSKYTSFSKEIEKKEEKYQKPKKTRRNLIEEKIIALILNAPEYLKLLDDNAIVCFSAEIRGIIKEFKTKPKDFWKDYKDLNLDEEKKEMLNELAMAGEAEKSIKEIDSEEEIAISLKELIQISKKERLEDLSEEIKKAEVGKDAIKIKKLSKEFNELAKSLLK